ncbi:hypothetical protein Tco_0358850, partial [Tanacetum coccineum]
VDFRAEAQLFVGTVRSDDGMDRFRCSRSVFSDRLPPTLPQVYSGNMITSNTNHPDCWMEVEKEVVIETTQKRQRLLKFQRDLLVVEEEVVIEMTQKRQRLLKFQRDLLVVKDEVESQVVF